jgi:hypothetical protein
MVANAMSEGGLSICVAEYAAAKDMNCVNEKYRDLSTARNKKC